MAMQNVISSGIDVLTKTFEELGTGVYVITPYRKEFNFFAYLGFGEENFYEYDNALTNKDAKTFETKVNGKAIDALNFKTLGNVENTITTDGKRVTWYEQDLFNNHSKITADSTGTTIEVEDIDRYAVNQLVSTAPVEGSTGTEMTVKVTAIDEATKTLTVNAAVNVKAGDILVSTLQLQKVGFATTGSFGGIKTDNLYSVFGKYGAEVEFNVDEINSNHFFMSPQTFVDNRIKLAGLKLYTDLANAFFKGTNAGGDEPVTLGLEKVITERDANGLPSIYKITGDDEKAKLKVFQDKIDLAATSPVYNTDEPLVIANDKFARKFASAMRDADVIINNNDGVEEVKYGLKTISSPLIQDVQVTIVKQMNNLYQIPRAFVIPKHLIGFKQPKQSLAVDPNGKKVTVDNAPGKILIFNDPQVTGDKISFHLEYYLANVFAGMTYENSYMMLTWK